MHAGMAMLDDGDWQRALGHFETAIRLREPLPWREDARSAWLLAAAWINRSDALQHLGNTAEALRSLDRAVSAMDHVPLASHPAFPERLILAWINRAVTCGEMGGFQDALAGFSQAESLLETWGRDVTKNRVFLTAMLSANRARVLLENRQPLPAWRDARAAADTLRSLKAPAAAITACSLQCRALALMLDEPAGRDHPEDWIAEATDAAEAALALVKSSGFIDSWVADLVRYGAKIYRTCQPQFLAAFLGDWLIDGPLANHATLRREMRNELLLARAELEQRVFASAHDTGFVERQTLILKSLQTAAIQLA